MMARVFVPRDTTALAMGADEVADRLMSEAEARGIEIALTRNGSRGLAWLEPLVEVETDTGRMAYGPVSVEDVPGLLDAGLLEGATDHPLAQGLTESIPYLAGQQRLTFARIGVTDPLSLADYLAHDGFRGLETALTLDAQAIVDEVKTSGLRGRGGAAFPTGIKWQTVHDAPSDQKYIVCNADEGDSGTFADRLVMECDPYMLIEGMAIAGLAVGATQGYIYLRSEYPLAHRILDDAIARAEQAGYLGADIRGSGRRFDLEVRLGAGAISAARRLRCWRASRQARHGSLQAAAAGHRGAVRTSHRGQQRALPGGDSLYPRPGRTGLR